MPWVPHESFAVVFTLKRRTIQIKLRKNKLEGGNADDDDDDDDEDDEDDDDVMVMIAFAPSSIVTLIKNTVNPEKDPLNTSDYHQKVPLAGP